jgi:hypothetical protein
LASKNKFPIYRSVFILKIKLKYEATPVISNGFFTEKVNKKKKTKMRKKTKRQ